MSNKIVLKKSSVGAKVPLVTDLDYGEVALNYADGKLYYKTSGNTIDYLPSASSTATLTNKTLTSPIVNTDVTLNGQALIKFADADSTNWVAFKAPTTISTNVTWTLPAADGTTGQVLTTNGGGILSWTTVSGGGGGFSDLVELSSTGITTSTTIHSVSATTYRGAKYTIQITNGTNYALYEFLVMHDGTKIYFPADPNEYVSDGNNSSYFSGDFLDSLASSKIQVGNTYHSFNWAISTGNLVFSASCSSGTISIKGAVLLIKA